MIIGGGEMKIQTPLRYPGGKSKAYPYIRELTSINKCNTYIEPYAGGARRCDIITSK